MAMPILGNQFNTRKNKRLRTPLVKVREKFIGKESSRNVGNNPKNKE